MKGRPSNGAHCGPITTARVANTHGSAIPMVGGDGRVGLYAGFCAGHAEHDRRRPSIYGLPSPTGSSGLPADSGGQPSNVCAGHHLAAVTLLALLRVGFTEPPRSPGMLVGSYPTVSPLPPRPQAASGGLFSVALSRGSPRVAVSNHPALWSPDVPRRRAPKRTDATARPTRPSRLPCYDAMDLIDAAALLAAGFAAGTVNAVAGGGSLITFPTLVAVGLPPVSANVTQLRRRLPGYVASVVRQPRRPGRARRRARNLLRAAAHRDRRHRRRVRAAARHAGAGVRPGRPVPGARRDGGARRSSSGCARSSGIRAS